MYIYGVVRLCSTHWIFLGLPKRYFIPTTYTYGLRLSRSLSSVIVAHCVDGLIHVCLIFIYSIVAGFCTLPSYIPAAGKLRGLLLYHKDAFIERNDTPTFGSETSHLSAGDEAVGTETSVTPV